MASFGEAPDGDKAKGEKIFKTKCAQCHVAEKGGGHKQASPRRSPQKAACHDPRYVGHRHCVIKMHFGVGCATVFAFIIPPAPLTIWLEAEPHLRARRPFGGTALHIAAWSSCKGHAWLAYQLSPRR